MATLRQTIRNTVNAGLGIAGLQISRKSEERDFVKTYISFRQTLGDARKAGLSVADYIDQKYQVPGATQATIDQLIAMNVFEPKVNNVCEIGPGSGRYLEKVLGLCAPCQYEIYETDLEWSGWLTSNYAIKAHDADGQSLRQTPGASLDLIHAHKVFVYIPFLASCQYLKEMIRVVRPGGRIIFDIVPEECMTEDVVEKWLDRKAYYPSIIPRDFVISYFTGRNCSLRGSFLATMGAGTSEYFVFTKNA